MNDKTQKDTDTKNPNTAYPNNVKYPPSEDIYNQEKKETEIDPEDPSKVKANIDYGKYNEKTFNQDKSGADLDIPGSELDDEQEDIGSEDEENNVLLDGDHEVDPQDDEKSSAS